MALPKIRVKFRSLSLIGRDALDDIELQSIQLYEGLQCVLYQDESENGVRGFLHVTATVRWNDELERFEAELQSHELQFTAGIDPNMLDELYND